MSLLTVPGDATSSLPAAWFPETKCVVGAPLGPATRAPGPAAVWTRKFEHAAVTVNLANRTASAVEFLGCGAQ